LLRDLHVAAVRHGPLHVNLDGLGDLGIPLLPKASRHGAIWEYGRLDIASLRRGSRNQPEKISRPISVPERARGFSMAKSRPPHSSESLARRMALGLALRSIAHVFDNSRP
jgi:hypothetical protein